jgi:hypothetical protein
MTQLDDYTRRALCAADQPPPGVEDRILAAILGPVGGPGPDGGGASSSPAPGSGSGSGVAALGQSTIVYAAKLVAATLGLAAGGVALLAITAAGVRSIPDAAPRRASVPIESAAQQIEVPSTTAAVASPEPDPVPLEQAPALVEPAAVIASAPPQRPSKPALAQPEDTIEAELALMKVARASKDHELALATLDRHRREFATGVFAAEREVLRVEHLCALGRLGDADTLARAFVARYPDNPLRSRVDPACKN